MNLRCVTPLFRNLGNPAVEVASFLGVGEVLAFKYLKFPILFDKSEDGDGIILELGAVGGVAHNRKLRR